MTREDYYRQHKCCHKCDSKMLHLVPEEKNLKKIWPCQKYGLSLRCETLKELVYVYKRKHRRT